MVSGLLLLLLLPFLLLLLLTFLLQVMQILLACLETCPTSTDRVAKLATEKLEAWALTQEGGLELQLKIKTVFKENLTYRGPGACKSIVLVFNDMFDTEITFDARRKKLLESMRSLAGQAVASSLNSMWDIPRLEVPRSLLQELYSYYTDSWRKTRSTLGLQRQGKKKKLSMLSLMKMKVQLDCPYCKRTGFKKLAQHIKRSKSCEMKHQMQLGFEESVLSGGKTNKSFW